MLVCADVCVYSMARVHTMQREPQKAVDVYEQVMEAQGSVLGEDSILCTDTLLQLAEDIATAGCAPPPPPLCQSPSFLGTHPQ